MVRSRSFRGRGISDSQRRKKTWISAKVALGAPVAGDAAFTTGIVIETPATTDIGDIGNAGFALIFAGGSGEGDEVSSLPEESTILRARGSLLYPNNNVSESAQAPSAQTTTYSFGFGVTDVRSLVGGTVLGPIVDADWDGWMFLRQSGLKPLDGNATMVDVKAMRKIQSGDALFFAAQSVSGFGAAAIGEFAFDMRFLVLLP